MIKITNPYSRSRNNTKEKFYKMFTKVAIPILLRLPTTKNPLISMLKHELKYNMKNRSRSVAPPDNIGVNFIGITVSDLVPVENINNFRVGAKRLLKKFPSKNLHRVNNLDKIDDFCDHTEFNIHGRSWHRIGTIGFKKDSSLGQFITTAEISASHISSSLIVVHFELQPSIDYTSQINLLIGSEMQDHVVYKPKLKNFFKSWDAFFGSNAVHKQKLIEDLILELKWRFLTEVNKHVKMYFYDNYLPAPSIEVYKIDQVECTLPREDKNQFLQSIAMDNTDFNDISIDGVWQINYNERNSIDNSLKISCNSMMTTPFGHAHLEYEILNQASYFAKNALPILVIRTFTKGLSEQIASFRNSIFRSIQKNKKYAEILKQRFEFEKNLHVLTRIKSEYEEEDFKRLKITMVEEFVEMTPLETRFKKKIWIEFIVDATARLINDTYNHSKAISKIFDDYLQLMTAETNLKLQKRTIRLTVLTVILTVITIVLTCIALYLTYYQITMAQKNLSDLINGLKDFLN